MDDKAVRKLLVDMLTKPNAHITFEKTIEGFYPENRGRRVANFPHTAWQLLEHLRIAQWDILEFSRNPAHVSPEFPDGYWPKEDAPPGNTAWDISVAAFTRDLKTMVALIEDPNSNLLVPFPYGDGQNLFREALVLAKHNSYHLGQLAMLKKSL